MKKVAILFALGFAQLSLAVSPFSLPWMNGDDSPTYNSADHASGVFVVEAYFLGCHYCNENAPNVNALAEKFSGNDRVQVLDVGIDRSDSDYETWIAKHSPNHPVLKDASRELIKQLGTTGYPSTYVIDCKGNVAYKSSGTWSASKKQAIENAVQKLASEDCQADDQGR